MKRCSKCGEEKPVSDFPKDRGAKDGLYAWCRPCGKAKAKAYYHANRERSRAQAKAWKDANPDRVLEVQRANYARNRERYAGYHRKYKEQDPERVRRREKNAKLKKAFGITIDEYDALLASQGGVCRLCGRPPEEGFCLAVDHCHVTGTIRGLLCSVCNRTLGTHEDDPRWFERAARYLRKHQAA